MDSSSEPQASPQLALLQTGLRSALTNALNDQVEAIILDYSQGEDASTRLGAELRQQFDRFIEHVLQFGDEELNAWCTTHGLDTRFKSVANARATEKYIEGHAVDPKAADTRITAKRDEVQRLTDLIRKEETNSANMRVMLARKEDAAKTAQGRLRKLIQQSM